MVPSGALELALWMESDRMGYLLPALTEAKFTNQRDVVLNERRQNYENRPYGLAPMALLSALFPPDHPYHWTTIGEVADLQATRLDEVHEFFRRFYHPANASLRTPNLSRTTLMSGCGPSAAAESCSAAVSIFIAGAPSAVDAVAMLAAFALTFSMLSSASAV